jgi:hypothetical protein
MLGALALGFSPYGFPIELCIIGVALKFKGGYLMDQIIIVQTKEGPAGLLNVQCIFTHEITDPAKRIPVSGAGSFYPAASQDHIDKIQSGQYIEEQRGFAFATDYTLSEIGTFIARAYATRVAAAQASIKPGEHYGRTYNGTSWS